MTDPRLDVVVAFEEATETLEQLVDTFGLADVLGMIQDICYGKAEHLRETWQDEEAAKEWEFHGNQVDTATDKILGRIVGTFALQSHKKMLEEARRKRINK